ncbi:hypothetical protein FBR05_00275 [Deltaproteobacteria bacterium PRO3]|nr:hypothetical protein [Deltaproteobacteria bacterium PRO3]
MQTAAAQKIFWQAHPGPQTEALRRSEFEILYGGARGGGKTECGLVVMIEPKYVFNPRYRFLVVRKNAKDLDDWLDRARWMYSPLKAEVIGREIRFPSGAVGRTGNLKDKNAFEQYIGHEYQKILIEEMTLIPSEESYEKLVSSCRSTVPGLTPQVFATTNPGNAGHIWVKNRFVKHGAMKPYRDPTTGRWRVYIPARVDDNPTLMQRDPTYVNWLRGLPPKLRAAWLEGNWDVFEGQFFDAWNEAIHVYEPFPIPREWRRFRAIDWGYSDHFCCLWFAVGPDNHVWVYREFYRNRLTDTEYRDQVASLSVYPDGTQEEIEYTVGDPISFWNRIPADSLQGFSSRPFAERWEIYAEGPQGFTIIKGDNKRVPGWGQVREYLRPIEYRGAQSAMLHISRDCKNLIRTLPALVHDDIKVEDVADGAEDHPADALRLGLQSRAPIFTTTTPKYRDNYEAAEAQAEREAGEGVDLW